MAPAPPMPAPLMTRMSMKRMSPVGQQGPAGDVVTGHRRRRWRRWAQYRRSRLVEDAARTADRGIDDLIAAAVVEDQQRVRPVERYRRGVEGVRCTRHPAIAGADVERGVVRQRYAAQRREARARTVRLPMPRIPRVRSAAITLSSATTSPAIEKSPVPPIALARTMPPEPTSIVPDADDQRAIAQFATLLDRGGAVEGAACLRGKQRTGAGDGHAAARVIVWLVLAAARTCPPARMLSDRLRRC